MSRARLAETRRAASSTSGWRWPEIPPAPAAGALRADLRAAPPRERTASATREPSASGQVSTGSCALPPAAEPFRHVLESLLRGAECPESGGFDLEMPLRASTPLRRRLAGKRADVAFGFEPLQRRIHGADRNLPTRSFFDFTTNRHAVRIAAQPHDGEHHDLFERAEELSARHLFCIPKHTGPVIVKPHASAVDRCSTICSLMQNKSLRSDDATQT